MPIDNVEVRGLVEAQQKLEQVMSDLHGEEFLNAMRDGVLLVSRDAKTLAPVDTGRLRASITPEIRRSGTAGKDVTGVVGSNVKYAAAMELGSRPHWPPISALEVWAKRHGVSPYLVARAIARRGTKARRFLQTAFEQNEDRIIKLIGDGVAKIVAK